jgi:hypothetical protein
MQLLYGEEIDKRLNWPLGKAQRLARRRKLPHVVLPDGSIRFEWSAVSALMQFNALPAAVKSAIVNVKDDPAELAPKLGPKGDDRA